MNTDNIPSARIRRDNTVEISTDEGEQQNDSGAESEGDAHDDEDLTNALRTSGAILVAQLTSQPRLEKIEEGWYNIGIALKNGKFNIQRQSRQAHAGIGVEIETDYSLPAPGPWGLHLEGDRIFFAIWTSRDASLEG